MSKGGDSQTVTQQDIPGWLKKFVQPLLANSAQRMGDFQGQGNAILQGKNYKDVPMSTQSTISGDAQRAADVAARSRAFDQARQG